MTLFFDLPVERAAERTNNRGEKANRMDKETARFYERVRDAYLQIAAREPQRFRIVDATGEIEEVRARVLEIVTNFLV